MTDGIRERAAAGRPRPGWPRSRRSGTWGSALTTDEFAAIRSVGFEPVGQVLGAAVYNIGYTGGYGCPGAWARLRLRRPGASRGADRRCRAGRGCGSFGPLVADHVRGAAHGDRPDDRRVRRRSAATASSGCRLTIGALPGRRPGVQGDRHRGPRARARSPLRHAVHLRPVRPGLRQADHGRLGAGRARARHLDRGPARRLADRRARPAGARATPR